MVENQTLGRRAVRWLLLGAGGFAVVAAFFFGTLYFLNQRDGGARDLVRAEHAKTIKAALENYFGARGVYPLFPDNPVDDLKKDLVDGGFVRAIPSDPLGKEQQYRYVSSNGKSYGLLFHLEQANGKIPAGGTCLTGVGTSAKGWWSQPPDCPF